MNADMNWDGILSNTENNCRLPNEELIILAEKTLLLSYLKKISMNQYKVLDLGYGNGTDLAYMSSRGFSVSGIDFSNVAYKNTIKKIKEKQLLFKLIVGSIFDCDNYFNESKFDIIYSFNTLSHLNKKELLFLFNKVDKLLDDTGTFYFNLLSKDDDEYDPTFTNNDGQIIKEELDSYFVPHTYYDKKELMSCLNIFDIIRISHHEILKNGKNCYWSIIVSKKKR